jgi:hypothetical protein
MWILGRMRLERFLVDVGTPTGPRRTIRSPFWITGGCVTRSSFQGTSSISISIRCEVRHGGAQVGAHQGRHVTVEIVRTKLIS